jgi:F0F1-type ATP synthase assembly protein I
MLVIVYMAQSNLKKDIASALTIGVEIIVILIVPILVGRFLDQLLNTNFIIIIFILLAVGAVFYRLIKMSGIKK